MAPKLLLVSTVGLAFAAAACDRYSDRNANTDTTTADAANSGDATNAVKNAEAGMLAAFRAKDSTKLTSYYTPDAVLAVPERTVKGTDAIAKANAEDLRDPAFKLDFTNDRTDVASSGDLAYTSGSFNVTYTNSKTKKVEQGKGTYVTVFRKQSDGSWKAVADIATPVAG
jgi:uncharacterized protein (TIGR02246 family)